MCIYIYFWGEDNVPCFALKLLADLEFSSPLAILPEPAFLLVHVVFCAIAGERRWKEMHKQGVYVCMPLKGMAR